MSGVDEARPARPSAATSTLRIAGAEYRLQVRRFSFWFFALIFTLIGMFYFTRYMSISAGEDSLTQGVRLARNSAYSLSMLMTVVSVLFAHFTASLSMDPVIRDRRIGLLPMVLSAPIDERDYVFGKFLGAAGVALTAPLFFVLTAGITQFFPSESVGLIPPNATGLLVAYLEFAAPLTLLISALSFSIATRTGNTKLVYVLVTVVLISYMLINNAIESIENRWLAAVDPTGMSWLIEVMGKGKTNAEQNALGWMMDGAFLLNRLVVVAGAILLVVLVARRFAHWYALSGQGIGGGEEKSHAGGPLAPVLARRGAGFSALPETFKLTTGFATQYGRILVAEFRLLLQERALFFLPLLLVFIMLFGVKSGGGPFDAESIPVTSEVTRHTLPVVLLFLFATTVFFAGESAFRERDAGLTDMQHACPVPESAIVLGKATANVALSLLFLLVAAITCCGYQLYHHGGAIDPKPFVAFYGGLILPTVVVMTGLSLFMASLARNKHMGYGMLMAVAVGLIWAFIRGHFHWLYNVPALGIFSYSDIAGLGPLARAIVTQRLYMVAIGLVLLFAAAGTYPRDARPRLASFSPRSWGRRGVLIPALLSLMAVLGLGTALYAWVESGWVGSLATERLRVKYEREVKPWLAARPEPEIAGVELDVDLYPQRSGFEIAGTIALRNARDEALDAVHVTVNPHLMAGGELLLNGRPPESIETAVATFPLASPLAPGEEASLRFHWQGRVPNGVPRHTSGLSSYIGKGGTFLHSLDPLAWLPSIGYSSDLEIESERTRRKFKLGERESLPEDHGEGITPGLMYQTGAFPYRAKIRAPEQYRVLSAGRLVAERSLDGRREFEYVADGEIYFFPIMAGEWEELRDGDCAVFHAAVHSQNSAKILEALRRARAFYSETFAPFPYADLRVAEFPRHGGTLAMGYPTLIPFSESIGFLTRDNRKMTNLAFYVTAHEVAHQWWGTVVWPAHAKGAAVLTEGLANYSTLLMAERYEGVTKRRRLFELFEDLYLRRRDPNEERPMMLVDGDRRGDAAIWYNRGGVVLYMLHCRLGEARMLAGLREYVRRYSFQPDHPTMTDFVALYEELYPETKSFFDQYVRDKTIPNPGFVEVEREELGDGRWRVAFEIANRSAGELDLVIEAHEGKRSEHDERERDGDGGSVVPEAVASDGDAYAFARTTVSLADAGAVAGEIVCDFRPDEIEMDPEGTVLLQERLKGRREL